MYCYQTATPLSAQDVWPDDAPGAPSQSKADASSDFARYYIRRSGNELHRAATEPLAESGLSFPRLRSAVRRLAEEVTADKDLMLATIHAPAMRDVPYIHSVGVAVLMLNLARQMGLDRKRWNCLGLAGMLHDTGKLVLPNDVLAKPERLSGCELLMVREHPIQGERILMASGLDCAIALDVCRHHHERYDGTGYPDGLKGQEISQASRMAAVCDVYDALRSLRPYKEAWNAKAAIDEMYRRKEHFDADILEHFITSLES